MKLRTKLAQAIPSPAVTKSIGEIHKSVHNNYSELHFEDGGKDEWLVDQ